MGYKNAMDMHIHTDNSPDGRHSTMLMCEYALKEGLRAVAVTDHCEVNQYTQGRFRRSIAQSYFETVKARDVFRGRLSVLSGIELGQPTHDQEVAEKVIDSYQFDIILASIHNLKGYEDFFYLDYSEQDPYLMLEMYFDEIIDLINWGRFDVLAHLTYPLRYIIGDSGLKIDMSRFDIKIEHILKMLAEKDKALEVNTSGLRKPLQDITPSVNYVKLFKEVGGKYVTVGSDAHNCEDVGKGINEGIAFIKQAGFRFLTLYNHHKPFLIDIDK